MESKIIGAKIIASIVSYLFKLALSGVSAAQDRKLKEILVENEELREALASTRPISDEVRAACAKLGRHRHELGFTASEEPLWRLLTDDGFQSDLVEWLRVGDIAEGEAARDRLRTAMGEALTSAGASPDRIEFLRTGYFDALEKAVFASPILAHWRHQQSLDYLRGQMNELRRRAEEAAGVFSPERQAAALADYCTRALTTWDIIDLSNLPLGDVHLATQQLLLRQLYIPLRVEVEPARDDGEHDVALARIEETREARRQREAFRAFAGKSTPGPAVKTRAAIGEILADTRRLVVLGDPGGGKTTMLRWLATAFLLRHRGDDAFRLVPDTATLPDRPWIPVLIRCRDLGEDDLCRSFTDFLFQHLKQSDLRPEDAEVMQAVVLERIARGEALLLVDGLDEITNPRVRVMFCRQLERTAARYPEATIVVTSRIVGYRDMPYRMGVGFAHGQIAELSRDDKDEFARRWTEVTAHHRPSAERAKNARELVAELHSSDRIERLTGNPMLLTTLALVRHQVGKLPRKRFDLYAEAVSVLLKWNPLYDEIDEDEAVPQLEYLAYEMCLRGVQRLGEEELLGLLDRLRIDYPNIRAIRRREPPEFLKFLEARSSILIKSGGAWRQDTREAESVWEFRHLTFQEYMAAKALLDGRYPDRDKSKPLAAQVAPLAGTTKETRIFPSAEAGREIVVTESWREALRLLVAGCKDDDVNSVLESILNPVLDEDFQKTTRPRAVLAAVCLADEPNVSEEMAVMILERFAESARHPDGRGEVSTSLERAAVEIASSAWAPQLKQALLAEFVYRAIGDGDSPGCVWAMAEVSNWSKADETPQEYSRRLGGLLTSPDPIEMIAAALMVMESAFQHKDLAVSDLTKRLLPCFKLGPHCSYAAAWAIVMLTRNQLSEQGNLDKEVLSELTRVFEMVDISEASTRAALATAFGNIGDSTSIAPLVVCLSDNNANVRLAVVKALGKGGFKVAVAPLVARLDDPEEGVRQSVAEALGRLGDKTAVAPLVAKLDDPAESVRQAVAEALGNLGDKTAVAPLVAKLDDPAESVRQAVAEALGRLGDKTAVAPLVAKLGDPEVWFRHNVAGALGRLGDKTAVAPLVARLGDPEVWVRRAVAGALGRLGDKTAVAPLVAKLDDPAESVRQAVAGALGRLGDKTAVAPLVAKLDDPAESVRQAVAEALGNLGDKTAVAPLVAKLDDPAESVRQAVAGALGNLGDKTAVAPLVARLKMDGENGSFLAGALHALRESQGREVLRRRLRASTSEDRREALKAYAQSRGSSDRCLLSQDFDGADPWLDPREAITEDHVHRIAKDLNRTPTEIRSLYEAMARDIGLTLAWQASG